MSTNPSPALGRAPITTPMLNSDGTPVAVWSRFFTSLGVSVNASNDAADGGTVGVVASGLGGGPPVQTNRSQSRILSGTLAGRPAPGSFPDGSVLYYATDTELLYTTSAGAWVQVMGFITYDPGTSTVTVTGNLAGTHAQNLGTGDSPTFVDITTSAGDINTLLGSLQSQIDALAARLSAAHTHGPGSYKDSVTNAATTGTSDPTSL